MALHVAIDRETITSLASAIGLTASKYTNILVTYVVVQAITAAARYTIDGTTPTASLGLRLLADDVIELWGLEAISKFRAIDDGGTAKLEVIYMR